MTRPDSAQTSLIPPSANPTGAFEASIMPRLLRHWGSHSVGWLLIVFFVFQVYISALWFQIDHRPPRWDESHYLFVSEHSFRELRALHPIRALDLHGVTSTKPGMIPFLTALTYFIFGDSPAFAAFAVNLTSIFVIGYGLLALSQLLLATAWPGFLAAFWFTSFRIVMLWNGYYQIDLPLAAAVTMTVLFCVRLHENGANLRDCLGLGAALALGMPVKHLYVAFIGLPVAFLLIRALKAAAKRGSDSRRSWPIFGATACGVAVGVLYHLLNRHIVLEQLYRVLHVEATGAQAPATPLWTIVQNGILDWHPTLQLAFFGVGAAILVWTARASASYLLLWIGGGWVGIALAASFPLSYYALPILPAFTLIGASVFGLEMRLAGNWRWLARGGVICCALALMNFQAQARLGSSNPLRLLSAARVLALPRRDVRQNPVVLSGYWNAAIPDGNTALLPYPNDWKTDDIVAALDTLTNGFEQIARAALLTDCEWMSGELFRYKIRGAGLEKRIDLFQPDFAHWSDPAAALGAPILIAKSGDIFKRDFYSAQWARMSQAAAEFLLRDDGAFLRRHGYSLYRSFPLPYGAVATIWILPDRLHSFDLIAMAPRAEVQGADS